MSEEHPPLPEGEKPRWLDKPGSVNKIVWALVASCVLVTLADLFYHKHGHYGFEKVIGFHGAYGFIGCVLLVVAAKGLRKLVMRDEDYYD